MFRIFLICLWIICSPYLYPEAEINSLLKDSASAFNEKRTQDGLTLLDKAAQLAEETQDAVMCLEIGRRYIELPGELERKGFAIYIFKKGAGFAKAQGKWAILPDFAMALQLIGERDSAIEIYDDIFIKAGEIKDIDAFGVLKVRYEELGDTERSELCGKMIEALTIPPPPDWQPLGETVRGPKKTSDVTGRVQRQIADQQVQKTMEYFMEKKKLEEQKKKRPMPLYPY